MAQGQCWAPVPQDEDSGLGDVVPPELPVLWDELRGLKELVLSLKAEEVGWRQALRRMESWLKDGEEDAQQQRQSVDRLEETAGRQAEELRSSQELSLELSRRLEELEEHSRGLLIIDRLTIMISFLKVSLCFVVMAT